MCNYKYALLATQYLCVSSFNTYWVSYECLQEIYSERLTEYVYIAFNA